MLGRAKLLVRLLLSDQSGATAIEYALIAAGVAVAVVAGVNGLGTQVKALFTSVSSAMN